MPSAPSSSVNTNPLSKYGVNPVAPTAPMYTASAQPAMMARIHQPTMQDQNQSTNRLPITNQATSTIQARRQNRFAGIANAINTVTNEVQKTKFENLTIDVTNVSRAQSQIAAAQQAAQSAITILKDPQASPEAKKAAQDALASAKTVVETNQKSMDAILKDDKRRKDMAKAFDVSFTDPAKNDANKAHIDAAKTGMEQAKKNEAAGLSANTPEEKAIQEYNKLTESGSYSQQFMKQQPQQLTSNPLYEAQLKQFNDQQKYVAQYIMPRYIDQQTQMAKARIEQDTRLIEKKADLMHKYYDTQVSYFGKIDAANIAANKYLQGIAMRNSQMGWDTMVRAQTALQLAGLKDNQGNWKGEALKNQSIGSFTNEINRVTQDNVRLKADNDAILNDPNNKKGIPAGSADEQRYHDNEHAIKMNSLHASQMADERQKYTSQIYGIPVVNPPASTDGATKGYVINGQPTVPTPNPSPTPGNAPGSRGTGEYPRFNIAPGISVPITLFGRSGTSERTTQNGPADDSAAATASQQQVIDSGQFNLQRGFEINNQIDPDDSSTDFTGEAPQ